MSVLLIAKCGNVPRKKRSQIFALVTPRDVAVRFAMISVKSCTLLIVEKRAQCCMFPRVCLHFNCSSWAKIQPKKDCHAWHFITASILHTENWSASQHLPSRNKVQACNISFDTHRIHHHNGTNCTQQQRCRTTLLTKLSRRRNDAQRVYVQWRWPLLRLWACCVASKSFTHELEKTGLFLC